MWEIVVELRHAQEDAVLNAVAEIVRVRVWACSGKVSRTFAKLADDASQLRPAKDLRTLNLVPSSERCCRLLV